MATFLRLSHLVLLLGLPGCGLTLDLVPGSDGGGRGTLDAAAADAGLGNDAGNLDTCGDSVVDPGEQCDDGNNVAGDGCEPGTCTYSCTENADCLDDDNCTVDRCDPESHACEELTVVTCRPPDECSVHAGCADDGTCVFELIDRDGDGWASSALGACGEDCNDGDPTVSPVGTEVCDMVDQDCDLLVDEGSGTSCARDADGDGFGSMASSTISCTLDCPSGYVTDMTDCWDAVGTFSPMPSEANPDQTAFFDAPRNDDTSYDWNCDGREELRYPDVFTGCFPPTCTGGGWAGVVAACGSVASYQSCARDSAGATDCAIIAASLIQHCR